jgi:ubiquitin carboxyl-terminal hydrolase 25
MSARETLIAIGVPENLVDNYLSRANNDVERAFNLYSEDQSRTSQSVGGGNPSSSSSTTTSTSTSSNVGNRSADEMQRVIEESMRTAQPAGNSGATSSALSTEEQQIQRALELSRQQGQQVVGNVHGGQVGNASVPGVTDEDQTIAAAVLASLQTAQAENPTALADIGADPSKRVRDDGMPVGLKNVGNTCYLNSMLQTYFLIPQLRRAVLKFPAHLFAAAAEQQQDDNDKENQGNAAASSASSPSSSSASNQDAIKFMSALQRTFARLILSNQKYIDPTPLLRSVVQNGKPVEIGGQQDVAEFDALFLQLIGGGLDLMDADELPALPTLALEREGDQEEEERKQEGEGEGEGEKGGDDNDDASSLPKIGQDFVKRLFYGRKLTYLNASELDGSPVESKVPGIFSDLIVHATSQETDLFELVDSAMADTIAGYQTPLGHETTATQSIWFTKLPPLLKVQLNRIAFVDGSSMKLETPVRFAKRVSFDRYRVEHRGEVTQRRVTVAQWVAERNGLADALRRLTNYGARDIGVVAAIETVADFVGAESSADTSTGVIESALAARRQRQQADSVRDALALLADVRALVADRIEALRRDIEALTARIDGAYADLEREFYALHGLWIHQGVSGSGHYWAYLQSPRTGRWIKFNDSRVSEVDEATVMREAKGGHAHASAYFLIYMHESLIGGGEASLEASSPDEEDAKLVHPLLAAEIADANEAFARELAEHKARNTDSRVDKMVADVRRALDQDERDAVSATRERDMRIKSTGAFLTAIGNREQAVCETISQHYVVAFQCGLAKDVGSSIHAQLGEQLGEHQMQLAVQNALEPAVSRRLRAQHDIFRAVAYLYTEGLALLVAGNVRDALRHLVAALSRDAMLQFEAVSRRDALHLWLGVAAGAIIEAGRAKLVDEHEREAITLFELASLVAVDLLDGAGRAAVQAQFTDLLDDDDAVGLTEPVVDTLGVIIERLFMADELSSSSPSSLSESSSPAPSPSNQLQQLLLPSVAAPSIDRERAEAIALSMNDLYPRFLSRFDSLLSSLTS